MGVGLSQGNLFGQSQVRHALVSQTVIRLGQSKGALSCGEPLYSDGGPSILKVPEASLPQMLRPLARYYGWNDHDCLLAISVSVE